MLSFLKVKGFAIIDELQIEFGEGFNVITGETGAGKSIIIDAVEALLGSRADATQVRAGTDRAQVEAEFIIPKAIQELVTDLLVHEDIIEDHEILHAQGDDVFGINHRRLA